MSFLLHNFVALTATALVLGAVYALVALGYTLVYGVLRLINFANDAIFVWGTFAAVWVLMAVGAGGGPHSVPTIIGLLVLALACAMVTSAIVALVVERVAYRRLRRVGAPPLIPLISAIGASFVLGEIMGLRDRISGWFGLRDNLDAYVRNARDYTRFPNPMHSEGMFKIGDYTVTNIDFIILVSALVMMICLDQFIQRSRLGRGIRAVAQDPESAALMGVNSTRVVQVTFLVGGLMAGAAATLYMMKIGSTRQNAGFILGVKAFTAAVMGGIGNLRGALLGGLLLGVMENWGSAVFGTQWKDVVAFVLLVLILLVRPTGILGESLGKARV
jgi:branched-chain amino acid transport system permease protein